MRRRNQRGAVLVEAAIVTPIVMLMLFSIVWGAFVFRSYLTVDHAAKVGVRSGSIAGKSGNADYRILQSIKPNLAALSDGSLKKVVVYRTTGFNQAPPANCLNSSQTGVCNLYLPQDLNRPESAFGGGGTNVDSSFPPSSRNDTRANAGYLGVYVEADPGAADFGLPYPGNLKKYQVLRIEAQSY